MTQLQNISSQNNVAILIVAASEQQNMCFWPTYKNCLAGLNHDLIIAHIDNHYVPNDITNINGSVIYENIKNLPHKAFGTYREYGLKYSDKYKYIVFISDDVILKRDYWLVDTLSLFNISNIVGVVGSHIFNNSTKYPHKSHVRAPFWAARTQALKEINWTFTSDHDGEMNLAYQMKNAGYICVQSGHKIDLAYDALQKDHIVQLLERYLYEQSGAFNKFNEDQIHYHDKLFKDLIDNDSVIESPYQHIGKRWIARDIEPFHGLICNIGINLIDSGMIECYSNDINVLKTGS